MALLLFDMNWCVMELEHGFFISSDNPVSRWVEPKDHHPFYGDHGFLNKGVMLTFPLSTRKMLILGWQGADGVSIPGYQQHAIGMNRLRAQDADEFLYAHIEHRVVRNWATMTKNSRPRMTTQGFGPEKFAEVVVKRRRWKGA